MSKPRPLISWVQDRLILSLLATVAGWGAGLLLFAISGLGTTVTNSRDHLFFGSGDSLGWTYMIEDLFIIGLFMGIYVLFVWFFVLFPLSLLVPAKSFLWKPRVLTLCGIFAGPSLLIGYIVIAGNNNISSFFNLMDLYQYFFAFIVPATIGGTTCYVGAWLNSSWDREFEADVKAGKLDALGQEADKDFEAGRCKPL